MSLLIERLRREALAQVSDSQPSRSTPEGAEHWSPTQEKAAKQIHDQAMLRLAAEVPPGSHAWGKEHRPDLWAAVLTAYDEVKVAFEAEDFAEALATVRQFETTNLTLFRAFNEVRQSRRLANMPVDEAEAAIMRVFNARRINPAPERDTKAKMQQTTLLEVG